MSKNIYLIPLSLLLLLTGTSASAQSPQLQKLTLAEAEKIAVQNHPLIQAAIGRASAARAHVTQERSAYYPNIYGSLTGVEAENNSRITAGFLNNPIIYARFANGFTVNQLVTDFGRTHELVRSTDLHALAEQENVVTTQADVLLQVDRAYYGVLRSQAVLKVAQETVKERRVVAEQVSELAKNKIKSGLDVSFANVDLAQAELLLVQAQNDIEASYAKLSEALGYSDPRAFQLAEEATPPPPAGFPGLLQQALRDRPDLISLRLEANAAHGYVTAQRDLWFPTVSATGAAGLTPAGVDQLAPRYAAAGFNVNIPIFNGHLFGALRAEASSRARVEDQSQRDLEDQIARDVRVAWLAANTAFQRLALTDQLLDEAAKALDLAQARYKLGLSSMVELSQAQLNLTQAQIEQAGAKYDYQFQVSALNYQLGALH